jgi:hypothetical protein
LQILYMFVLRAEIVTLIFFCPDQKLV